MWTTGMLSCEDRVKFAERTSDFDDWVVIVGTIMSLELAGNKELYLPIIVGQYFMIACKYTD